MLMIWSNLLFLSATVAGKTGSSIIKRRSNHMGLRVCCWSIGKFKASLGGQRKGIVRWIGVGQHSFVLL